MIDPILAELFPALEIVVLERLPNGGLYMYGSVPGWFARLFAADQPVPLGQTFPFLDSFLDEAAKFWWKNAPGRLRSGPCAATDWERKEFFFDVSAVSLGQRRFLLIELLGSLADQQHVLQAAREKTLELELVVKSGRALRGPIQTVLRHTQSLLDTPLTASQHEIVDGLRRTGEVLLAGVEPFGEPAKRTGGGS